MTSPAILGINFGQSYASIAVIDKEGHPSCIANEEGERQIACAISYSGEEVYIGNGAKPFLVKNGSNTIMGFRNLLGHTYDEVDHTAIFTAPLLSSSTVPSYEVDVLVPPPTPQPSKAGTPMPRSAIQSGAATPAIQEPQPAKKTLTVPEVTTLFLSTLFQSATDYLGTKPQYCVISAPTWFTPKQHEELKKAAEDAGITVLQVLDEAAAVLVGYRVGLSEERKERGLLGEPEEGDAGEVEKSDKKVVVLDMGETSLGVSVISVSQGEYTVLGKGRDDKLGGREFDNLLLKHFAKEFTKKTSTPLSVPCTETASVQDKRAEAKLRLAVEHTKRSLSASTGAATCAVESLKDGLDLSTSINRLRFDSLALPIYRQVGDKLVEILKSINLDILQIDEILLAGASTLFPGLQQSLGLLVNTKTPITSTIDPSQVIAVGCALQALHLSQFEHLSLKVNDLLGFADQNGKGMECLSKPIGLSVPGSSEEESLVKLFENGSALPSRRRFECPVEESGKVGLELWEGEEYVKITKVDKPVKEVNGDKKDEDDDEFSDDEEEDEEVKEVLLKKSNFLGLISLDVKEKGNVIVEVIVQKGGRVEGRVWEGKDESSATKFAF